MSMLKMYFELDFVENDFLIKKEEWNQICVSECVWLGTKLLMCKEPCRQENLSPQYFD